MSYEAGSKECRVIVEAKDSIIKIMQALDNLKSADSINHKLKKIYDELDEMHEMRKKIEYVD